MNGQQVRKQWDEISESYSDYRDPNGPETDLITDLIERFDKKPRVLDVGCGDGERTLDNLTESSIGIDVSRSGLDIANKNVQNELIQADMKNLPFENSSFDAITAYFSVFHVPREKHGRVYEEFNRVLSDGGWVLMTLPSGRFHTVRTGWMGGRMLFSSPGRERTVELLRDAGLTNIETVSSNDPFGGSSEFVFAQKN